LLDGERAVGVATSEGEIRADVVVLASGAYGTPGILLRSGIGPESGLPVGENLLDHVGVGAAWEPTDRLRTEWDAWERDHALAMAGVTVAARSSACPEGVCDLFMLPATDPGDGLGGAVFAMKPRSRGAVTLPSSDPRAPLRVDHGFLRDGADVEVLVEGFEQLRDLARTEPIARYAAREQRP